MGLYPATALMQRIRENNVGDEAGEHTPHRIPPQQPQCGVHHGQGALVGAVGASTMRQGTREESRQHTCWGTVTQTLLLAADPVSGGPGAPRRR